MSFSMAIRQHYKADPDRADRWEKAFLELQVLLACSDGVVAPSERMSLALMSLARRNEKENREIVDSLINAATRRGFDETASRVLADVRKLAEALPEARRSGLMLELLRDSVAIVIADDVVSDKERSFVLTRLAPQLSIPVDQARAMLDDAATRASRARTFVSCAFEMYVMIVDASSRAPFLHAPPGGEVPGFLGAVDEIVTKHKLGSSRAVSYFLGALAGVFWVEDAQVHCATVVRLAEEARRSRARSGLDARLGELHADLEQLAAKAPVPDPFLSVTQHLTSALNRLHGLDPVQRDLFRERVAPALHLDHADLLESAARRKSLADLHRNLTGTVDPADSSENGADDPGRWWRIWK